MTGHQILESWAFQATWSIREAAYLVNEQDPLSSNIEILATSTSPVSQTYYWLRKEYEKGNLIKVDGTDEEPRFSPGTLMRRLIEEGRHVSSRIQSVYDNRGKIKGPHKINLEAILVYRKAAKLIWDQHPKLTLSHMAKVLTGLPSHMTSSALALRSRVTIKNYLKGLSPNKPGRPPKGSTNTKEIDLAEIVKNMTWE